MVSAAERAYEFARESILTGSIPERTHLSEDKLGALVGCSRTPVREALRRLRAEGLVEFRPNKGAYVVAWSQEDLVDVFQVRALLEGHAAFLATSQMSEAEIDGLLRNTERMEAVISDGDPSAADRDKLAQLDIEFHRTVLLGAGSPRLLDAHARVVQVPLHHRLMRQYNNTQLHERIRQHGELVRALFARDALWAQSVMRSHVLSALNIVAEQGEESWNPI